MTRIRQFKQRNYRKFPAESGTHADVINSAVSRFRLQKIQQSSGNANGPLSDAIDHLRGSKL